MHEEGEEFPKYKKIRVECIFGSDSGCGDESYWCNAFVMKTEVLATL